MIILRVGFVWQLNHNTDNPLWIFFISSISFYNKSKNSENPNGLILDAGDFSMGTLIQTVYEEEAAELRMLGDLGCDVTTLGNHEYDYRSAGLASMFKTAVNSGDRLPSMVLCNVDWESMNKKGITKETQQIKDAFDYYGVKDYVVVKKGDVKTAVFGVFERMFWLVLQLVP